MVVLYANSCTFGKSTFSTLVKSLAGPFPQLAFCPTGGLTAGNFRDFLALDNVVCCGGSWMVAPEIVAVQDWERVRELAAQAMR